MNIPPDLMQKIEELEAEKSLRTAQEQANLEIQKVLDEEDETDGRAGRNGNVPPKSHRFQPGQSGNPSGRPPCKFNRLLRKLLAAQDQRYAKEVAEALVKHACAGNQTAIRELLNRAESTPQAKSKRP